MTVVQDSVHPGTKADAFPGNGGEYYWYWLTGSGAVAAIVDTALYEAYLQIVTSPSSPSMGSQRPFLVATILLMNVTVGAVAGLGVGIFSSACMYELPHGASDASQRLARLFWRWYRWLVGVGSSTAFAWLLSMLIIKFGCWMADPGGYVRMQWKQRWAESGVTFDFLSVAIHVVPVVTFTLGSILALLHMQRRASRLPR